MKRKLVLWGENEKEEKQLLALELLEDENAVNIYTFPQDIATQEFYNEMMDRWREHGEVVFPEGYSTIKRSLKVSEGILPEELKVERTDLISRAQAEWHFIVLSSKLYDIYNTELSEIEEKIENTVSFDNSLWEEMKNYWNKVSGQVRDKNIFREHADSLKVRTNKAFDNLKEMRKEQEAEFDKESAVLKASFLEELAVIEEKIEKKLGLKPLFGELKALQNKLRNTQLSRKDNNTVWNKIDKAFKDIKEIKYGARDGKSSSSVDRIQHRYDGLLNAIQKMERSIKRDRNDLDFQDKRMSKTDGQLEMQLRQAKAKVIEERVNSKQEKLDDMLKTKVSLEAKMVKEKEKEAQKLEQAKIDEAKKAAKEKIAASIEEQKEISEEISDKLEEAAAEIRGSKDAIVEKIKEVTKEAKVAVDEKVEEAKVAVSDAKEAVSEKIEEISKDAKSAASESEEVVDDKIEEAKKAIAEAKDSIINKTAAMVTSAQEVASEAKESFLDKLSDAKDAIIEAKDSVVDKTKDIVADVNATLEEE